MRPYYEDARHGIVLYQGDCRDVMAALPECSVDAIVTDPPYGIHFMAKSWDQFGGPLGRDHQLGRERSGSMHAGEYDYSQNQAFQAWTESWASEALRILKPGGHMLVCGSPRTYHRMASGIEDAGFGIRDCLQWLFGSGFPKSLNLHGEWEGWGTALKPAFEPIVLARKPLVGTVAGNVAAYGTGGLNIDGCRIEGGERALKERRKDASLDETRNTYGSGLNGSRHAGHTVAGRWPANVMLDGDAAVLLDAQSGETLSPPVGSLGGGSATHAVFGDFAGLRHENGFGDRGGASRFFYIAKTSRGEREFGLDDLEVTRRSDGRDKDIENPRQRTNARRNDHPTVKPVDLMRWLCRLITPPGGTILDPFLGSGSTGMAALDEGFRVIGIDLEAHYLDIAQRRITRRHLIEPLPPRESGQGALL